MSIGLMSKAWDLQIDPQKKLMLLAVCDSSTDEGYFNPDFHALARKVSCDPQKAEELFKSLTKQELISPCFVLGIGDIFKVRI